MRKDIKSLWLYLPAIVIFSILFFAGGDAVLADTGCLLKVSVDPVPPHAMRELDSLTIVVRVEYNGPTKLVSLAAEGLPSFASGWSNNSEWCRYCTVIDTITFYPDGCDAGNYDIFFIGRAGSDKGYSDTVKYDLHVIDVDGPCMLEAGDEYTVWAGNELTFEVTVTDPDSVCDDDIPQWRYWGYPFSNGATMSGGDWKKTFSWTPDDNDTGMFYAYFKVTVQTNECRDSVAIAVLPWRDDCHIPVIVPEPEYTQGTSNTIYYVPACEAYTHEVCYFDFENPSVIMGCWEPPPGKLSTTAEFLSATYENLEDGHRYGYYVKAYFNETSDSFTHSDTTSSVQDASPPDDVNSTQAEAMAGGVIEVNWYGVEDHVSYVASYEVYRKNNGFAYSLITTIPATEDNDIDTPYMYRESLLSGTGLEEGEPYSYMVRAVDAVGNRSGGIETEAVVPDSTPPCMPVQSLEYDARFMYEYYIQGVNAQVWGKSNCTGLETAYFIRFQAVRDSVKYFDAEWHPGSDFFDSDWIPYDPDSVAYLFEFLPLNDDTDFVNGHRYYYRAQAKDSLGNISRREESGHIYYWSEPISAWQDAYPPSDISNLTATSRISPNGEDIFIDVAWDAAVDAVSGLKKYFIYRKVGDGDYALLDSTTEISYRDRCTGIEERVDLCYKIGSIDYVGNERNYDKSGWEACAKPHLGPSITLDCGAIIENVCYAGGATIRVSWPDYDYAQVNRFLIEVNDNEYYQYDETAGYYDTPIPNDGSYDIRVRAIFSDGSVSTWSNTETVIKDGTPPTPVETLEVSNSDELCGGYMYLDWSRATDDNGIGGYIIIREPGDSVGWTTDTSWVDTDESLVAFESYCYEVLPFDALGNVQETTVVQDCALCNRAPAITSTTVDNGEIEICWDRTTPAEYTHWIDSVRVTKENTDGTIDSARVYDVNCYPFPAVDYGAGIYNFELKEIIFDGEDSLYTVWSCPYPVPYDWLPDPVTSFELQPQPLLEEDIEQNLGRIFLVWEYDDIEYVESFKIVRTDENDNTETFYVPVAGNGEYTYMDNGLTEEIGYTYCIMPVDRFGQEGDEICVDASIIPIRVYTPRVVTGGTYFNGDQLSIYWEWIDENENVVDTNYGAAACQVQVDISPDFDTPYSNTGDWVLSEDGSDEIYVGGMVSLSNRTVYRRCRAQDRWGNISPWSNAYETDGAPITWDNQGPAALDTLIIVSEAVQSTEAGMVDVYLDWPATFDMPNGSGFMYYNIYFDKTGEWDFVKSTTDTFFIDSNINTEGLDDCEYMYKVQPVDSLFNERVNDRQEVCLSILPIPFDCIVLAIDSIEWSFPDGIAVDSFYLERSYEKGILGKDVWMNTLPGGAKGQADGTARGWHFAYADGFEEDDTIYFHIKAIRGGFQSGWSDVVTYPFDSSLIQSDYNGKKTASLKYSLQQNYPNPFNPVTKISFAIKEPGYVTFNIYNIRGALVKTLVNGSLPANRYEIIWDGTNSDDVPVASGVYFYKITANQYTNTKKMMLIR